LVLEDKSDNVFPIRYSLFRNGLISFALGFVLWLLDMHLCDQLLPIYLRFPTGGMTLHILWHLLAGYSTFSTCTLLTAMRLQYLGHEIKLRWMLFCLPICESSKR
jgi:hypothetical protein